MGPTWVEGLLVCLRATLGDAVIFVALFGAGSLLFGRGWFMSLSVARYAVVVGLAVAIQIAVERAALATGRWSYQPWHPSVLGAGVLPSLQAVVLVPLTFDLLAWWQRRRTGG